MRDNRETPWTDETIRELQRQATKDTLSGLLNRATVEQSIKKRLQAMGPEDSCALFIVDLDHFKQVNANKLWNTPPCWSSPCSRARTCMGTR